MSGMDYLIHSSYILVPQGLSTRLRLFQWTGSSEPVRGGRSSVGESGITVNLDTVVWVGFEPVTSTYQNYGE